MKKLKLSIPDIKALDIPKPTIISLGVLGASCFLFLLLLFTLGTARDQALQDVERLNSEVSVAKRDLSRAIEDFEYVANNQGRFERLMASDKLIPHTRRAAIRQLQANALDNGLTTLDYNFQSAGTGTAQIAAGQPKSDSYAVSIENLALTIDAPVDRSIFQFIDRNQKEFPGALVLQTAELSRAPVVSPEALNLVSSGQASGLVSGRIVYSWRTAQQNKDAQKGAAK